MISTLKTSAVLLAFALAAAPALGEDRVPRAGAPTSAAITEAAPTIRKPRSGAPVVPASTDVVFDASSATDLGATTGGAGLGRCGYKYCGSAGR